MQTPLSDRPVANLKGIGAALSEKLARLGITTLQDLLFHLPIRYEDRTRITPIGALRPYRSSLIEAEVLGASIALGRRRSLVVKVGDGTGITTLRFFHFNAAQKNSFKTGSKLRCFGEARPGAGGLELYHPEYQLLGEKFLELDKTLTPIYPATEGVTQNRLRNLVAQTLDAMNSETLADLVPTDLRPAHLRADLIESLLELHRPPVGLGSNDFAQGCRPGQQLLAYEELLAHQLSLQKLRAQAQSERAPCFKYEPSLEADLLGQLHFAPTAAQKRVAGEIYADLAKSTPMLRLLQGDVGCGKTLVAAMAVLQVVKDKSQVALMVPTEILAEQHMKSFSLWFTRLGYRVVSLTGRHKGKARAALLELLASGAADLVIGTHALFQDDVDFASLGLVIIDEQHRFGVGQRFALTHKASLGGLHGSSRPHQLVMTATPIPRTLAMSHYSNLDLSVIDEFPAGRSPVQTLLVGRDRREDVVQSVLTACSEGRQAYWVCTLIEESENFDLQAAELAADELRLLLPELSIGLLHGRMKPNEKDAVMNRFRSGEIQLLVSTTVIEVGVDVANASLMVIENPERLGLAQLHQLRGRVGRGSAESHCVLLYGNPLSDAGRERLKAMRSTTDGFALAEIDLQMRGPGELLGARQAGDVGYRIADIMRDQSLLAHAKAVAPAMLASYPLQSSQLIGRWLQRAEDFAAV